jgi:hypothetical protein
VCKRIYLDTDLWNTLFYQKVDPDELMQRLREEGAYLAFGSHNLYEIAKSFHRTKNQTKTKGKELVAFLMKFFEGPILHPIESGELLKAEANVNKFMREPFADEIFVKAQETNLFKAESQALLQEPLRPDIADFIENRKMKVADLRTNQMARLANRPTLLARLKAVASKHLKTFLQNESQSAQALRILDFHLHHVFPALPLGLVREVSNILLNSGIAPFTHSLIRTTLYMNWRAANYGGLASDVPDDMYHVLNATYRDIYATGEAAQSYAIDLLASKTTFRAYPQDKSVAIDDWLVGLIS